MTDGKNTREIPRTVTIRSDPLVKARLLTKQEADAFVYHEILQKPKTQVAADMGISESAIDGHVVKARQKIKQAEETLELVREYTARFGADAILSEE